MAENVIRVLIADDHALVREGLRVLIGATTDIECVGMASDGAEVVAQIEKVHPDIAIVDIEMPTVDGIETTKQIKARDSRVAVLILSAYNYPEYVQACLNAGADGYLLKCNAETDAILGTIRAIHSGKKVLDEQVFSHLVRSSAEESKKPDYSDKHGPDFGLTRREFEVLQLVTMGQTNKEIAIALGLSEQTVGSHLVSIFRKLDVRSRVEAALRAVDRGWFRQEDKPCCG